MRQVSQSISVFLASAAILATSSTTLAAIMTTNDLPPENIELKILKDDLLEGEAILSGLIRLDLHESRIFTQTGNNWLFRVTVEAEELASAPFYSLKVEAQHLGEETPGPLLQTPSQNIDDASFIDPERFTAGKERETVAVIHQDPEDDKADIDRLTSILIDLNPQFPSFGFPTGIDGDYARTISAQFISDHAVVPEPLTLLGTGTALLFGAGFKRKLSKKQ